MTQLPALHPLPDDIGDQIRRLLQAPHNPDIGPWLLDLVRATGHMSTGDDMQWRLLCIVWLSLEYSADDGWPYLQWLNTGEPTLSSHLSDILLEALDAYNAHIRMTTWLVHNQDERLVAFFSSFFPIPAQRKMAATLTEAFANPTSPETGLWLTRYCEGTAFNHSNFMRPWRLLAAAWISAAFDADKGLDYLQKLTGSSATLSAADNKLLTDAATQANGVAAMIQMIADCPNPAVKTLLKEFGHPDLSVVTAAILQERPNYHHLANLTDLAASDAKMFARLQGYLQQAGLSPKSARVLDLACGPLAAQTLLFSSAGYKTVGIDLDIPPAYLPLAGVGQWFKRRKHVKAWQEATFDYYQALARHVDMPLKWKNAAISLADLTRLDQPDNSFEAVICINHLHHAPDVNGLLAQAARVLKPGGLFVANIQPYAGLAGAFQIDPQAPWAHLRDIASPPFPLNRWREAQFEQVLQTHFQIQQWLSENDPQLSALLTEDIWAELSDYSEEELTCKQIVVVATK